MAQIKDLKRMCRYYKECANCGLYESDCSGLYSLPDNVEEIVDNWVKEHPVKTYKQDFFEKFPNAVTTDKGIPVYCCSHIYGDDMECPKGGCGSCCVDCWNQEMKGSV